MNVQNVECVCVCATTSCLVLSVFHHCKVESTQSQIFSKPTHTFSTIDSSSIHRIFMQILKIYSWIIFENYNENSLEVLIFAKWTKFNLHFIHLTLYWERCSIPCRSIWNIVDVAENVVEHHSRWLWTSNIDVRVQNGWNRDIEKRGRQSILKSILNQHNTQSKSSRYFKIIERCSNPRMVFCIYCFFGLRVSSAKIRSD